MGRKAKGADPDALTAKEQLFVDFFLGECKANGTEAAFLAGFGKTRKSAGELASRLLKKVKIQRAVHKALNRVQRQQIINADRRDELLSDIAEKVTEDVFARIRAISELNKCTGRHSIKHLHSGKLTLEQVLAASRE